MLHLFHPMNVPLTQSLCSNHMDEGIAETVTVLPPYSYIIGSEYHIKTLLDAKKLGGGGIKPHRSCINSVLTPKQLQTAQMSRCISPLTSMEQSLTVV